MRQLCTRHWQLVARRFARYSIRCLCEYTHVTQSLVPNDTSAATLASTCHKGAALDAGLDLLAAQDLTVPPESSALAATWKANADTGSSTPVPKPPTRPKKSRKQERFIERSLHATCSRVHVLFQDKDPDSLPVLDGPTKAKYAKYWNNQVRHRAVQALEGEPGKVARASADTTQRHLGHALGGKAGDEAVAQDVAHRVVVSNPRGRRGSGSAPRLPSWGCEGTAGCPAASETPGGCPPAWPRRWGPRPAPGWPAGGSWSPRRCPKRSRTRP